MILGPYSRYNYSRATTSEGIDYNIITSDSLLLSSGEKQGIILDIIRSPATFSKTSFSKTSPKSSDSQITFEVLDLSLVEQSVILAVALNSSDHLNTSVIDTKSQIIIDLKSGNNNQFSKMSFSRVAYNISDRKIIISNDIIKLSLTEESSLIANVLLQDNVLKNINEAISLISSAFINDNLILPISENIIILANLSSSDNLNIIIIDNITTIINSLSIIDKIDIIYSEEQFIAINSSGADPPYLSLTELSTVTRSSSLTDDLNISLTEQTIIQIDSLLTDNLNLSLAEQFVLEVTTSNLDSLNASLTEQAVIQINNLLTDDLNLNLTEQSVIQIDSLLTDNLNLSLIESSLIDLSVSDNANVSLTEQLAIQIDSLLTDNLNTLLTIEESTLQIENLFIDNLSMSLTEQVILEVWLSSLDVLNFALIEQVVTNIDSLLIDNLNILLIEDFLIDLSASDNVNVSLTESSIKETDGLLTESFNIYFIEDSFLQTFSEAVDNFNLFITEQVITQIDSVLIDNMNFTLAERIILDVALNSIDDLIISIEELSEFHLNLTELLEISLKEQHITQIDVLLTDYLNIDLFNIFTQEITTDNLLDDIAINLLSQSQIELEQEDTLNLNIQEQDIIAQTDYLLIENLTVLLNEQQNTQVTTDNEANLFISLQEDAHVELYIAIEDVIWEQRPPYHEDLDIHYSAEYIKGLQNNDPIILWKDLSGNGLHATQYAQSQQPKYITNAINGLPVVRFNKANSEFLATEYFSKGGTIFVVTKIRQYDILSNRGILGSWNNPKHYLLSNINNHYQTGRGDNNYVVGGQISTNIPLLLVLNHENEKAKGFNNINELHNYDSNFTTSNINPLYIGNISDTNGRHLHGDIGEILIYNRNLTTEERLQVTTYLDSKWNISNNNILVPVNCINEQSVIINNTTVNENIGINLLHRILDFDMFTTDQLLLQINEYRWSKLKYPLTLDILRSKTNLTLQESKIIINIINSKSKLTLSDSQTIINILDSRTVAKIKKEE